MLASLQELERAIGRDEIVPYFQPIVELGDRRLRGFEVLARWPNSPDGFLEPSAFIRQAEDSGLIQQLTESVLSQACAAARTWPAEIRLSVNLSTLQLSDQTLSKRLRAVVEAERFSMDRITFEITESALLGDVDTARSVVRSLKDAGSRLAIDDFGTGYSSLNHLRALPFDVLKVDASFVRSMTWRREDRKIVAAVVGLGHSLGLTTIAEGVEELVQAEMLICLGCHIGQGWLYGRAVPANEADEHVAIEPSRVAMNYPSQDMARNVASALEALPGERLAQLQALYEGAPVGICFLDRQLRYVSLNKRMADIHNVPVEAHLGRTVAAVLPDIYESLRPRLEAALRGEASGYEVTLGDRALLANYQPARDEVGEVVGISVAVIDISRRKRAENALREREANYLSAVGQNAQVSWTADPSGLILDVSPRWTLLTGLTQEEVTNDGWQTIVHPDDLPSVMSEWMTCINTGDPLDVKYRVRCASGAWLWMDVRAAARKDDQGQVIRWYGTAAELGREYADFQQINDAQAAFAFLDKS
ncbi:PAS domain S-box [Terriglobus roseus DSM 18391]|uniref:PAS domain S-box n=1 Tax=Terriglobus roseus (strain DSM 18391 / NRRL B-41598 / KBS 63) TaxID=926566 RepID=I3ZKG3_TERRK|nr:EAL domain-containing protein [Terriglobus roseus]AFL89731.1 PAS domain S-box [Terriglobus roseus DSM 18391]